MIGSLMIVEFFSGLIAAMYCISMYLFSVIIFIYFITVCGAHNSPDQDWFEFFST